MRHSNLIQKHGRDVRRQEKEHIPMKRLLLAASLPLMTWAAPAAAETVNCTNITALPHTITVPGVYCLKQDLATSITSGAAITINANSVTLDFNGYRLGGLGGGPTTGARGVYADNRKNITIRNGTIRGFFYGILFQESISGASSGHVIENNLVDLSNFSGIQVSGSGVVIRDNRILNTTATSSNSPLALIGSKLQNSRIIDNLVAGTTTATQQAYGINLQEGSNNVEIARNTVLDTRGNSFAGGIWVADPGNLVVGNVVIGVTSATATANGIWNTSGSLICRDNTVANVTNNPTVGCTSETGTFPPVAP